MEEQENDIWDFNDEKRAILEDALRYAEGGSNMDIPQLVFDVNTQNSTDPILNNTWRLTLFLIRLFDLNPEFMPYINVILVALFLSPTAFISRCLPILLLSFFYFYTRNVIYGYAIIGLSVAYFIKVISRWFDKPKHPAYQPPSYYEYYSKPMQPTSSVFYMCFSYFALPLIAALVVNFMVDYKRETYIPILLFSCFYAALPRCGGNANWGDKLSLLALVMLSIPVSMYGMYYVTSLEHDRYHPTVPNPDLSNLPSRPLPPSEIIDYCISFLDQLRNPNSIYGIVTVSLSSAMMAYFVWDSIKGPGYMVQGTNHGMNNRREEKVKLWPQVSGWPLMYLADMFFSLLLGQFFRLFILVFFIFIVHNIWESFGSCSWFGWGNFSTFISTRSDVMHATGSHPGIIRLYIFKSVTIITALLTSLNLVSGPQLHILIVVAVTIIVWYLPEKWLGIAAAFTTFNIFYVILTLYDRPISTIPSERPPTTSVASVSDPPIDDFS